jgi:hypothetical protein
MSAPSSMTFADLCKVLKDTGGQPIATRMKAVHGERYHAAFENGDWRGVSFVGQDLSGVNFKGSNLLKARWDEASNINGCQFAGALIDKGILKAGGLAAAKFDEAQSEQIAHWNATKELPLGVPLDELPVVDGVYYKPVQYHALIKEAPDFATAAYWLESMRAAGFQPNCGFVTIVIAKPRHQEGDEAIRALVSPLVESGQADRQLINAAIGNVDEYESARYWFGTLGVMGFRPDDFSFNSLIRLLDFDEGKKLIAEMEAQGIKPDRHSYNPLIRKAPNFNTSLAVIKEMKAKEVDIGIVDYYALLYAADGTNEIGRAKTEMLRAGYALNIDAYNRMFHGVSDFQEAVSLWKEIVAKRIKPDEYSVKGLLGNCGTPEQAAEAFRLLRATTKYPSLTQVKITLFKCDPSGSEKKYEGIINSVESNGKSHREAIRNLMSYSIHYGDQLFDELFG